MSSPPTQQSRPAGNRAAEETGPTSDPIFAQAGVDRGEAAPHIDVHHPPTWMFDAEGEFMAPDLALSEEKHLSDAQWEHWWDCFDTMTNARRSGRNGAKLIGGSGNPDQTRWIAVVDALIDIGRFDQKDRPALLRSEWIKYAGCPGCGSSGAFVRRDKASSGAATYDAGQVRVSCGRRCRTRDVLTQLGIETITDARVINRDDVADENTAGASWRPVDLGPYLRGEIKRTEPTVGLARDDGLRLLYAGKEHTVIGEMESGKSWFAIACVYAELAAGNHVVYIHFEEADPADTVERLQGLDMPDEDIATRLRFAGPNEPVDPYVLAALLDPAPSLVILDGVNEAMSLHGMGIREEDGAAAFRRRLVKPCTAVGAAVLGADHVVKDRERRGRDPLGSIHKGNGLTGSLILLENAEPFGRGERGCSHLFVTKDRPGYLRRQGRPDRRTVGKTYMGSLIVDDTRTWRPWLDLAFLEPQDRDEDNTTDTDPYDEADRHVLETVRHLYADGKTVTTRAVRAKAKIGNEAAADALTRLTLAGDLAESTGPRGARIFTPVDRSSGPVPIEGDQDQTAGSGPRTSQDQSGPETGDGTGAKEKD